MKKYFQFLVVTISFSSILHAQSGQYGNEWIDYAKTYYKIKIGANGIYRIPKASLDATGIPGNTQGSQFILYKYGQEVPIYTTTSGSFGSADYIEFYGTKNDGRQDRELYNTGQQLDDKISLFSDTAAYFLTYDNQTNHLRYLQISTSIPPIPPLAVPYCVATVGSYYRNYFFPGKTIVNGYDFFSSQFDDGEGYVDQQFDLVSVYPYGLNLNNIYSGVNAKLNASISGLSYGNTHFVKVYANNQLVADSIYGPAQTETFNNIPVSSSALSQNTEIKFAHYNIGSGYDKYGVAFVELEYPHSMKLGGADFFNFKLTASNTSQYLEFSDYNTSNSTIVLYDVTNKKRYLGDLGLSGYIRFYIDPSFTDREFVLYGDVSNNIYAVSSFKTIHFTNYTQTANQGDYIIITHPDLAQNSAHNYVADYKTYRSSLAGGSFQPVIADVTELYDEFAYGTSIHPLAIKHFLKYAYDNWSTNPKNVFIIGRGLLYYRYKEYLNTASSYAFSIVPTYGHPGSDVDFVNFLPGNKMSMNIGRLSAWNSQEVSNYLDKVKAYENAIGIASQPSVASEFWKKTVLHLAGGSDPVTQVVLLGTLNEGASIVKDSLMGATVTTVAKSSTSPIANLDSKAIDSMINNGVSVITFHGHATAGNFDFNLNTPELYHSLPKLPLFIALGCDVAQIFDLNNQKTISEKYLNAINGGSIAMMASSSVGFTNFHNTYLKVFYNELARRDYGGLLGKQFKDTYDSVLTANNTSFYFAHLESNFIQGDPALKMYGTTKPDFHISADGLSSIPLLVSTEMDSFKLKIVSYNLARTSDDTIIVKVEHINPAGAVSLVGTYRIAKLYNTDTSLINVPINKVKDLGFNRYRVTIDATNFVDEMSETNNVGNFDLFIYSDNLVPVYPKEFAIVHSQSTELKASTINPFRSSAKYRMEIDTTETFNSPLLQQTTITSIGGVIKWKPNISYKDSIVYYWRAAFDSSVNNNYQWTGSSFIYLAQGNEGWNQSHYYQYQKNEYDHITLDNDRRFRYTKNSLKVEVKNTIVYTSLDVDNCKVNVNDVDRQRAGCGLKNSILIMVFDPLTGQPWANVAPYPTGAMPPCPPVTTRGAVCFEYSLLDSASRNKARKLLDSIPNGYYVMVKNLIFDFFYVPTNADDWKADTLVYGSGKSLYHALTALGFSKLDSVKDERTFFFLAQKGNPGFSEFYEAISPPGQGFVISHNYYLSYYDDYGTISFTDIGPAKEWTSLKWKMHTNDTAPVYDSAYVNIIGIDTLNGVDTLYTGITQDTSLNFIDAHHYPNIRIAWNTTDSQKHTTPQLDFMRVLFTPVPEAALNPSAHYIFKDSVQVGQSVDFSVAIENLTDIPMDSILVKYRLIDANSVTHHLATKRYRKLPGDDTLHASLSFDANSYPGKNILFIEANPDNDQPEQYHPNNIGFLSLKVITDESNPLLDVTFDGVHILDKDIISAKPLIKVSLKDENKYLALDDTSLIDVYIRYPHDSKSIRRKIPFDGTICKFIPAKADGSKNEASIEYRPIFTEDSTYDLMVNARDKTGNNVAGTSKTDYEISFNIFNHAAITRILNYPNPFSTATSFVFTMTGSEIPSQFKIQIMTVTGKVVREILKQELGPLHIGRNITEYKWDGKDQYGQMLGNGVYLYRVVTTLNGTNLDRWKTASGAEEKFFNHEYGKMYIMR